MKILIFSDLHIHPHKKSTGRLEDCLKTLEWVFRTADDRGISNLVFLGDLFHDRQKIDVLTYQKTFEIMERNLSRGGLKLFLLLGNHDLWHYEKLDVSSVNPLRSLPGVTVISRPSVLEIGEAGDSFHMGFLPYTHSPIEDLKLVESEWSSKADKGETRLLGGHVAVDGATWNSRYKTTSDVTVEHEGNVVRVGPEVFDNWDRVFLGHYHASQMMSDSVEYVGSPLQLSFGEADQDKHIIVYDNELDALEYVKNEFSPRHVIIKEGEIEGADLAGNFVRLEVEDIADSRVSELRQRLVEASGVSTLEIKQSHRDESHVVEDAKSIFSDEGKMIERYVDQVAPEGLDRETLVRVGSEICSRASEE